MLQSRLFRGSSGNAGAEGGSHFLAQNFALTDRTRTGERDMAAFQEVFRCSGGDERRSPPGMVVPLGADNIVALIDPGRKLKVEPIAGLEIKEIDGAEIRTRVMQTRNTFSEPDIDPQLRAASLPA